MNIYFYQHSRYDVENFNCVNFTREARTYLDKLGLKTYPMVGTLNDGSGKRHSWVGIDFFGVILNYEPQICFFFLPEWKYKDVCVDADFDYY